jgi:hypothetical protein
MFCLLLRRSSSVARPGAKTMKQRILIASIATAVIIVVAIIFFATQVPENQVKCTDSDVYAYLGTSIIGVAPTAQTETTVRSYTTTLDSTATAGYVTFTNFTSPFTNGNEVTMRSCTYIN